MLEVLSVSQFISQVNDILAGTFTVEGEVSQYKISQGKWIFFDLKDESSCLNCFSTVFMLRAPLADGMRVRVTGYPKIHEKSGRFGFTVQQVALVGEGTLQRAYLLLKEKLQREGLFAAERKRTLPELPERIGVIASRDSAAFGDFKRILNNRWGGVEIALQHVAVQGEGAAREIVQAFRDFNEYSILPDVLVLIRGGGSLEDLAAFNAEEVARAIYSSRIPVLVGVGHERDETLADLVADARASTPSNAAEIVVPERRDFLAQLDFILERVQEILEHRVALQHHELNHAFALISSQLEAPLGRVAALARQFDFSLVRIEKKLEQQKDFIKSGELLFANVDPKRVLKRGYSITRDGTGNIVRAAEQVDRGDTVVVELAKGAIDAQILRKY